MAKYKITDYGIQSDDMAGVWWPHSGRVVFGERGVVLAESFEAGASIDVIVDNCCYAYGIDPRPTPRGLIRMAKKLLKQHEESNDAKYRTNRDTTFAETGAANDR